MKLLFIGLGIGFALGSAFGWYLSAYVLSKMVRKRCDTKTLKRLSRCLIRNR